MANTNSSFRHTPVTCTCDVALSRFSHVAKVTTLQRVSSVEIWEGAPGVGRLSLAIEHLARQQCTRPLVLVPSAAARNEAETLLVRAGIFPEVATPTLLARLILRTLSPSTEELEYDLVPDGQRGQLLRNLLGSQPTLLSSIRSEIFDETGETLGGRSGATFEVLRAIDLKRTGSTATSGDWLEIAPLVDLWEPWLHEHRVVDRIGLINKSRTAIESPVATADFWKRFPSITVVDADRYEPLIGQIIDSLIHSLRASEPESVSLALIGHRIPFLIPQQVTTNRHARSQTDAPVRLIVTSHPGLESESIIGAVLEAAVLQTSVLQTSVLQTSVLQTSVLQTSVLQTGKTVDDLIEWHKIAIVTPTNVEALRPIARSALRADVPVQGSPPPKLEGPFIDSILELAEQHRQAATLPNTLAAFVDLIMPELRVMLSASTESADLAIGLLRDAAAQDSLTPSQWCERLAAHPVAPLPPIPALVDAVWMGTLEELLDSGINPSVIVLRGMTEGVFPAKPRPIERFDPGEVGLRPSRDQHIQDERRRFDSLRQLPGLSQLICVAAPEAGVLVSRFVEKHPREKPTFPSRQADPARWPVRLLPTTNPRPLVVTEGLKLSATQITMFENCPWQYTLQYRLNLPNKGGMAARFGSYVHEVLEKFVVQQNQTLDDLLDLARTCWSEDITDYLCQEDDYFGRAITALTAWYLRVGEELVQTKSVLKVEHRFSVNVGPHAISGFIDRVDLRSTDQGTALGIVDYKTAKTPKSEADTETDLQLAIYHLAATRDPDLMVHGPVQTLSLDFLVADTERSMPIYSELEAETEARILDVAHLIQTEIAEPNVLAECTFCDLHRVCHLQTQGRPVPLSLIPQTAVGESR
jgi:RecB family exonuclease